MLLPSQVVPSKGSVEEWAKTAINSIIRAVGPGYGVKGREQQCWNLYYGEQNESDFEYLTGSAEYRMPSKMRFMPIARPFFDLLVSTEETRKLDLQVYAVDTGAIQGKKDEDIRGIMDAVIGNVNKSQEKLALAKMQLDILKQSAAQAAEGDPQAQLSLKAMEIQLASVEQAMQRGDDVLGAQLSEMERRSSLSGKTTNEVAVSHGLEYLAQKYGWKRMFDEGLRDLVVVDNEIYRIEDVYEGKDPQIRKVSTNQFYYLRTLDAVFTDESPAVMEERWMTHQQILDEYGDRLTAMDRVDLEKRGNYMPYGIAGFPAYTSTGISTDACADGSYSGSSMIGADMIRVCVCEWKASRRINVKYSPNKWDEDMTFTHLVGDDEQPKEKERIERRYLSEWWGGVRIGNNIFVDVRRLPFQHRDVDRIGKSYGRYIAYAYNGIDRRPYSRVWAVNEIVTLYNILYHQLEMLVTLSGIRGVIMDEAQIPKDMDPKQWYYHFKQGLAWIDSQKQQANGRVGTNFNQFQTYDMTFGNSIQQILALLQKLEELCGRVIGIPPQRLGEIQQQDQVGTTKASLQQSALVTETLYYKHDQIKKRCLDRIVNVLPYAWKNGRRGRYVMGSTGQKTFEIATGQLDESRFEVFVGDNGKNSRIMDMALSVMSQSTIAGNMSTSQLISAFKMDNLNELEESLVHWEQVASRRMEQMAAGQARSEQEALEAKAQMDAMVKKQLTDGEALKGKLEQFALQLEQQRMQLEADVRLKETQMKTDTQRYVADQNTAIEGAYLQEQGRKTNIEAGLSKLQLMLDNAVAGMQQVSSGRSKEKIKD